MFWARYYRPERGWDGIEDDNGDGNGKWTSTVAGRYTEIHKFFTLG